MLSIKQIEKDPRVDSVEKNPDWNLENTGAFDPTKYFLWLKDGYVFEEDSKLATANSVEELNELLKEIRALPTKFVASYENFHQSFNHTEEITLDRALDLCKQALEQGIQVSLPFVTIKAIEEVNQ